MDLRFEITDVRPSDGGYVLRGKWFQGIGVDDIVPFLTESLHVADLDDATIEALLESRRTAIEAEAEPDLPIEATDLIDVSFILDVDGVRRA